MRYRETSAEQEKEFQKAVQRVIVDRRGFVYKHGFILTALRLKGTYVSKTDLRQVIRELDPRGVESRMFALKMRKKEIKVAGLNQVFLVNRYNKLKDFGFEIYAFIDGYSRYVP